MAQFGGSRGRSDGGRNMQLAIVLGDAKEQETNFVVIPKQKFPRDVSHVIPSFK